MPPLPVRVRFAPSPTGFLHIGGARTALFNWLYAKHHGGSFVLRIEDTDQARSTKESVQEILDSLRWLGIPWDEEPIYQSSRKDQYRQYAEGLVAQGLATRSTDPDKGGEAIVFKVPAGTIVVEDLIYGRVSFDASLIKDQVLIKSDGMAAYNFACVVDDATMKISPVIRGEDHLSNTPKQVALYNALGFPVPQFAHVPLILGPDRSRLSKRHGATAIMAYKQEGFMPEALFNYLVLLGWSPGNNQEIMAREDIVRQFDLDKISRKGAVFDHEKLLWMNSQYIKQLSPEDLTAAVRPFLVESGVRLNVDDDGKLRTVALLLRERLRHLKDIVSLGACFFEEEITLDDAAAKKHLVKKELAPILSRLAEGIAGLSDFNAGSIEKVTRDIIAEFKVKSTPVIQAARVAATGKAVGAGLFETLAVLGKETCARRILWAVKRIQSEPGQ
jgi:glutamyl-tRNA synthetase